MNAQRAQRERVLNAWAKGAKGKVIAMRENLGRPALVFEIITQARKAGDPRAVSRSDSDKAIDASLGAGQFSMHDLCAMDEKFKRAMLAAMANGFEQPPAMGVFKAKPKVFAA